MSHNALFILITILFDGVAVAWAVREFILARPDRPKAKPPASPEDARHPEG